jgi:hypothetical protein
MHGEHASERRRVHPIVPHMTSVLLPGDGRCVGSGEWMAPPFSICIDTSNTEPFEDLKPFSKIKKHAIHSLVDAARALELLSVTSDDSIALKEFPKILVLPLPHGKREAFFPQRIQKILKMYVKKKMFSNFFGRHQRTCVWVRLSVCLSYGSVSYCMFASTNIHSDVDLSKQFWSTTSSFICSE